MTHTSHKWLMKRDRQLISVLTNGDRNFKNFSEKDRERERDTREN